jgi:hypothetical protein
LSWSFCAVLAVSGCCGDPILVADGAEDRPSADAVFGQVDWYGWCVLDLVWGQLPAAAVWSAVRVVVQPLGQHAPRVVLVQDEDLVEQFSAGGADQALADGVRAGCADRAA